MRRAWLGALQLVLLLGCTSAPPAATPGPAPELVTKPVSFSILEDYDKGQDLREVERDFRLFHRLGVTTWRGSFGWDDYEPAPGRYDFAWLHRFADLAERYGITLRPYLGYTPEWAASGRRADGAVWNDPPRRLDQWAAFVARLAGAMRRHRNLRSYEIYNEENTRQWWDGTAAEYDSVLARAAGAIRRAAPGTGVLLGGLVWPDADWAVAACRSVDAPPLRAVPIHAYPETWTPDSVTVENYLDGLPAFLEEVDGPCDSPPIWLNEIGYATTAGRTELEQAGWWVRAVATFLAVPRVEEIGIYEIKDLPPESAVIGEPPNYHLGLTYADGRPKLAFSTVAMLVRLFSAQRLTIADPLLDLERTSGSGRVFGHLFRRDGGPWLLVVWARGGDATVRVWVDGPLPAQATEFGLDGRAQPTAAWPAGRSDFRLTDGVPRLFLFE